MHTTAETGSCRLDPLYLWAQDYVATEDGGKFI